MVLVTSKRGIDMADQAVQAADEAYKAISNFANTHRMDGNLFADNLIYDHKLLQSYVVGLMMECIAMMAITQEHRISPQNRAAVELCKKIVEAVGDNPQYL